MLPSPPPEKKNKSPHPFSLLSRYKRWIVIGLLCLLLTNLCAQLIPYLVKKGIDSLSVEATRHQVTTYLLLIVGFAVMQAGIRIISRLLIFNAGRNAEYDLRQRLFSRLCRLDRTFYHRLSAGDLLSRLTNDVSAVRALLGAGLLHVGNTLFAYCTALPMMLRIEPMLTLYGLLPYPLLLLGARAFARGVYTRSHALQRALSAMSTVVEENLAGIREVKAYRLEPYRQALFTAASATYLQQSVGLTRWRAGLLPLVGLGAGVSLIIVLWAGGRMVIAGQLSLGSLVAFSLYLGLLAWPTISVGWIMSLWQRGIASWHRLLEILDASSPFEQRPALSDGARSFPGLHIEARKLTVPGASAPLLDQVSLQIPPGSISAIVGRVGSGKTTLAEAIAGLIPIGEQQLFIGGLDVTLLPVHASRRLMAFAPQHAFLFSKSVQENIADGLSSSMPIDEASREKRIAAVIRLAGLELDLKQLPHGLGTVVGERGIALSGGQRQRIALARALISDHPILILDDSLSAVDAETEQRILAGLREALGGRTTILISHRPAALQLADQIIVLEKGQVAEMGTHDELLAREGIYTQLYRRQLLQQEWTGAR